MNEKKSVGLAVTSMVLGIVSLLFGCCFWYVTIPAAVIAVILAAVSLSKQMGGKGMAISGLVTGIISLVPAIIVLITGSSLMATFSGDDDSKSKSNKNESSIVDELSDDTQKKSDIISIASWELDKDDDNKDVLVVEYEWKNTDDEAQAFSFSISDTAYQNGVELETAYGCDSIDSGEALKKLQSGKTQKVKVGYVLQDMTTVNIIAKELLSFSDDELLNENIEPADKKKDTSSDNEKETENNEKKEKEEKEEKKEEATVSDSKEKTTVNDDESQDSETSKEEIINAVNNGDYSLVTPEFKEFVDSYEDFYDGYIEFMKKYSSGDAEVADMLTDYTNMMSELNKWTEQMDAVDESTLSTADDAYFIMVSLRIEKKLLEAGMSLS